MGQPHGPRGSERYVDGLIDARWDSPLSQKSQKSEGVRCPIGQPLVSRL